MINCNEIITVLDILSMKKTNTTLMNCHSKKVRDCYILHTVLLAIILLLIIIIIICYHYAKQKSIDAHNIKWKIMN